MKTRIVPPEEIAAAGGRLDAGNYLPKRRAPKTPEEKVLADIEGGILPMLELFEKQQITKPHVARQLARYVLDYKRNPDCPA